jgi:hypothetical protein
MSKTGRETRKTGEKPAPRRKPLSDPPRTPPFLRQKPLFDRFKPCTKVRAKSQTKKSVICQKKPKNSAKKCKKAKKTKNQQKSRFSENVENGPENEAFVLTTHPVSSKNDKNEKKHEKHQF